MDRSNLAWTIPSAEEGSPLRSFLKLKLEVSNKEVGKLLDVGKVQVNGRREQFGSRRLKKGEKVAILGVFSKEPKPSRPKPLLDVLHEDEAFLVINKEGGLPSQMTRDPKRLTCEGLVQATYKDKGLPAPILLHRLDRDTSGVLLFGKTEQIATRTMDCFRQRKIKKIYLAICEGTPPLREGHWSHHLGPKGKKGGRTFHACLNSGGQKALTDFQVMATGAGASLWELKPHTGRTHQLRVQCSEARHPIFGDHLYGAKSGSGRHLLHAAFLELPKELSSLNHFQAPLHPDFKSKLKEMGSLEAYQDWSQSLTP